LAEEFNAVVVEDIPELSLIRGMMVEDVEVEVDMSTR
jgi:hypothetical protein